MTHSRVPTLLATSFVADQPEEGTCFPSAGGNSSDPRVQAVYWRCLAVLFASARYSNPEQRLAFFSNVSPPVIDGISLAELFERWHVEVHIVPITARLAPGATGSWGNVLYFHDIMDYLAEREDAALRVALIDADVIVTAPVAPLFALLDEHTFAGYVVPETRPEDTVNGLSLREMDRLARVFGAPGTRHAVHFGGEMFVTSLSAWRSNRPLFAAMLRDALAGTGIGRDIVTEEHIYSIAFAALDGRVARTNHLIKRIWTSPRYNTVAPGDEDLMMWHLPAEKRYGFRDLFEALGRRGFPQTMPRSEFRDLALTCCGLPRKRLGKILRDGVRQIGTKLRLPA